MLPKATTDTHLVLNALNTIAALHAKHGMPENDILFAISDHLHDLLPYAKTDNLIMSAQLQLTKSYLALYSQLCGFSLHLSVSCTSEVMNICLPFNLRELLARLITSTRAGTASNVLLVLEVMNDADQSARLRLTYTSESVLAPQNEIDLQPIVECMRTYKELCLLKAASVSHGSDRSRTWVVTAHFG
ncbi:MAG: hypothetical protein EAZ37_05480 [Burkholderiales bacterium]|nr:MAG: hypothetical protein EAZ37_05480 [Burkholderiales bacterium]